LASRGFAWPVLGAVTQPFGVPELGVGAPHTGVDIGVGVATPVLASASGVVSFAGGDPAVGYGYYAIIDNGGGVSTLYGHLALPPFLHPGQFLAQGGLIGLSGSSGFSTGPHVHFEVRLSGVPVDPLRVLPSSTH
jgi:murein DD-endopeptidase MepM/ murein hydrolase activator NlpD